MEAWLGVTYTHNMPMNKVLNSAFTQLSKRAETNDPSKLVATFVDTGNLVTLLKSHDHQVIYGRRGTGKTHALLFLSESARASGDLAIYVDMRTVGSTGGIYADPTVPLAERGTRLLVDTLAKVHEELLQRAIDGGEDLSAWGPALDSLAQELTAVKVVGSVELETTQGQKRESRSHAGFEAGASAIGLKVGVSGSETEKVGEAKETRLSESGIARHRVHFGATGRALAEIVRLLGGRRLWTILDEWSSLPLDLQPFLADFLRRSLLPVRGITAKIGAIEHRSKFRILIPGGDYIGLELGADVSADLNLDDFMVFDNNAERAKEFFGELLFKHVAAILPNTVRSARDLRSSAFTQHNAFDEFVRAAEGVPRDAINVITLASLRATEEPISVHHIRGAAKTWYQRDKEAAVSANPLAHKLLNWIIDKVIAHRRARAFLLRSDIAHPLIEALFDARVLHVLKKSVSSPDNPGDRFNVYGLDFGCYVDLIATAKAPQGLFAKDGTEKFLDVPPDDYRSIRSAVLDLDLFKKSLAGNE